MLPIKDSVQKRNRAWMTWSLIGLNAWVFLVELIMTGGGRAWLLDHFLLVPAYPQVATLFGYMFLHSGVWHLVANMWFLWLFGDNVEDRMGPFRFLAFYLSCGLLAAGMHIALCADPYVPVLGASGAVAGVMGAYALMFPRARIDFVRGLLRRQVGTMSAWVYMLLWFGLQCYMGVRDRIDHRIGGVAWWAHIGGFVAGCLLFYLFVRDDRWSRRDPGYLQEAIDTPAQARRWPIVGSGADAAHQRYGRAPSRTLDDVAPCRDGPGSSSGSGDVDSSGD
jgi:membrane associated rhomboid family serine protease